MAVQNERFQAALEKFDAANAEDPHMESVDGKQAPSARIYGHRMTEMLDHFAPDASEELKLAIRAQHLMRWVIPRGDFPEGLKGYNKWRRAQQLFHAEKAGEILEEAGYEEPAISRVQFLLRKEKRTTDAEAQTLEDVASLVFIAHYFKPFVDKYTQYDEEKLVDIVQKTWRKMSPQAHEAALKVSLPEREQALVVRAVSG